MNEIVEKLGEGVARLFSLSFLYPRPFFLGFYPTCFIFRCLHVAKIPRLKGNISLNLSALSRGSCEVYTYVTAKSDSSKTL